MLSGLYAMENPLLGEAEAHGDTPNGPVALLHAMELSYVVQEKVLLHDISATFEPTKVTALMGPSGAGKTTLLTVLCGRGTGELSGLIHVNGAARSPAECRSLMSLMPQDDILLGTLTVRQTLYYTAMLVTPPWMSKESKVYRADEVMRRLGLEDVAHRLVGSELVAGVSGGQRKRVSAAIEFLSGRPLLFMDEPTSGLDAASAMQLGLTLAGVASHEGRTVIATIHQPSWSLLACFSKVILLGQGGVMVFQGPPNRIAAYFAEHGSALPPAYNAADHMLDMLQRDTAAPWAAHWVASKDATDAASHDTDLARLYNGVFVAHHEPISWLAQYQTLLVRVTHLWVSDPAQARMMFPATILSACLLSAMQYDSSYSVSKLNLLWLYSMSIYQIATPILVVMPLERAFMQREYRNGAILATPYWLARVTLCAGNALLLSVLSVGIVYPMLDFPKKGFAFGMFYGAALLEFFTCMVLSLVWGLIAPDAVSGLKGATSITILMAVTSGFFPPASKMAPYFLPMRYPNIFSWCLKIFAVSTFHHATDKADAILKDPDVFGVNPGNVHSCFLAMAIIASSLVAIGYFATMWRLQKQDQPPRRKRAVVAIEALALNQKSPSETDSDEEEASLAATMASYGAVEEEALPVVRIEARALSFWRSGSYDPKSKEAPDESRAQLINISCVFEPGTATALMGPSGAGKSTLLDVVSGRARGLALGEILVDGAPRDAGAFRLLMTLTPQENTLLPELTIRETLKYTAELRCHREWNFDRKMRRADDVAKLLGLEGHVDTVCGSATKPSLSGGQRKRLSIGMELLADRPVMFVDEPTTGLDAAASAMVADIIIKLASVEKRTVVCTVHQPPWHVIARFDSLVLLAQGRLVFAAAPSGLRDFFAAGGAPCAAGENAADHMMFVLSQDGHKAEAASEWAAKWAVQFAAKPAWYAFGGNAPAKEKQEALETADPPEPAGYAVSPWAQYCILTRRCMHVFLADENQAVDTMMGAMTIAVFNGLSFRSVGNNLFLGCGIYIAMVSLSMQSLMGLLLIFPIERPLVDREYGNGVYASWTYWAARSTVSCAGISAAGFAATPVWWLCMGLPLEPSRVAIATLASTLLACIFGILDGVIGVLVPNQIAAAQFAEPCVQFLMLTGGGVISRHDTRAWFIWAYEISPVNRAFQIICTAALHNRADDDLQGILRYFSVKTGATTQNFGMIACWLLGTFLAGFAVCHYAINKKKR
ncbi:P-loop containing nucleoside triphosphate hydrolase protein [Pelagophyceae sp. CCMP2097]|nr:P-loop containing nucleoside triphosphate hydrolase protein [Pelagophyceae sp. CCMP2097]